MRAYLHDEVRPAIPAAILDPAWHVIRAVTGKEQEVAQSLAESGIPTFCPMHVLTIHFRGRLHQKIRALFQNYLFAKFLTQDPHRWHQIMDTSDVIEIIGGSEPKPLPAGTVEAWIARTGSQDITTDQTLLDALGDLQRGYRIGDYVTCEGAYIGQPLLVIAVDDNKQTVRLQLRLLGRDVVIERLSKECIYAGEHNPLLDAPPNNQRGGARRSRRGGQQSFLVRSFRQRRRFRIKPS